MAAFLVVRRLVPILLKYQADHCRAAVDHIEFARRCATHVDDATTAIRTTIGYAHDHGLAVANVLNQHLRAKSQRAMSGRKSRGAGYLAARGIADAIERSHSVLSATWAYRHRRQNDRQG